MREALIPPPWVCHEPSLLPTHRARFNLPAATLQAAFQNEGVCSRRFVYFPGTRKVKRIETLIKAAQKVDIANCLLSLSHEVSTGSTTAFILGDGVTTSPISEPSRLPGQALF
jgi:hypothetical protein